MKRVYDFLKNAGIYYLATVDEGTPKIRPFSTVHIFEDKLYIQTGKGKEVFHQLEKCNEVEICTMHKGEWIRVSGKLIYDDRTEAQESLLDEYEFLRKKYTTGPEGNTAVYYFKDAKASIESFSHEPVIIAF